jgi:hypothetical protein
MGLWRWLLRLALLGALAFAPGGFAPSAVAAPKAAAKAKTKKPKAGTKAAKGGKGAGKKAGKAKPAVAGKTAKAAPKAKAKKIGNATIVPEPKAKGKAAKLPPKMAKGAPKANAKGPAVVTKTKGGKAPAGATYTPPGSPASKTAKTKIGKGPAATSKVNGKGKLTPSSTPLPIDELEAEDSSDGSLAEDVGYVAGLVVGVLVGLVVFVLLRRHGRGANARREQFQYDSMPPEAAFATALSSFEKQRRPIGKGTGVGRPPQSQHAAPSAPATTGASRTGGLSGVPHSTMDGTGQRLRAAPKQSFFSKISTMLGGAAKRAQQEAMQRAGSAVAEAARNAGGNLAGAGAGALTDAVGLDGVAGDVVGGLAARAGERGAAAVTAKASQAARAAVTGQQAAPAPAPTNAAPVSSHAAAPASGQTAPVSGHAAPQQSQETAARAAAAVAACSFERFAEIQVALSCWKEQGQEVAAEVKRHFGVTAQDWKAISDHWSRKLAADQSLRQQFNQFVPIYRRKYMTAA